LNGGEPIATEFGVTDVLGWGYSLANLGELLFGCLDAIEARSVLEIGAFKGELTTELLDWADRSGARIIALDPEPPDELLELGKRRPELDLMPETSHDALRKIELTDAIVVDGDHNYYTLSEELRIVAERAQGGETPLMMFHDVSWPHARRDTYYVPERIPEEHRQPLAHDVYLAPWESGVSEDGGLPFVWAAEREGGPRNGTLTALEDFVSAHDGMRLVTVPAFFGFGVVWHEDAPWSEAVARLLEPWDRNPVLERLEANRVAQIASRHVDLIKAQRAYEKQQEWARNQGKRLRELDQRLREQRALLTRMLNSRAIGFAELLSRVRRGSRPTISREEIRRVLAADDRDG
jgi:Methyltransferase domain